MKNLSKKSFERISILSSFATLFCLFISSSSFAVSITQIAQGNWSNSAIWSTATVPTAADDVTLLSNKNCVVNISNAECLSITVVNTGTSGPPCSLKFNSGSQLTVGGNVILGTGGTRNCNIDMTAGGTLVCNGLVQGGGTAAFNSGIGTVILNATMSIPSGAFTTFYNLTLNNGIITAPAGTLNIKGALTTNTTFIHNSGTIVFNGTGLQVIGGGIKPILNNVTINNTLNEVELTNAISINGVLSFVSGKLNIKNYDLTMIGASSIINMTPSMYIKTSSTGKLKRSVGSSPVLFPIGNTSYNPVEITNTGTQDFFGVYVIDNVTDDGSAIGTTTTFPVVNRTWMLEEDVVGGSLATVSLQWNTLDEINSFDRGAGFMAHYESGPAMWDNIGGTVSGTEPFSVLSSGITGFSPFSISSGGGFAPLPTELISFQAVETADREVEISWSTASEHNSSHFTIHHSTDGINWNALTTVGAANQSTEIVNYSVKDNNAVSGLNYYRLTQFDTDGNFKMYEPVSVKSSALSENSILVYPNPGNELLRLELMNSKIEGEAILEVFSQSGALIHARNTFVQSGYNNLIVDDLKVDNGVYFLQIRSDNYTSDRVVYVRQ